MEDQNAPIGWTEAQWNRVRAEVLRAWQSVRVAGSFLPTYGPLPPSTQVVPSEVLKTNGTVDERSVAPLLEISLPVTLSRQQIREEDLSSAILQFRRRAAQLAQLEDWYVFNGTYPYGFAAWSQGAGGPASESYYPDYPFLSGLNPNDFLKGAPQPIAGHGMQQEGLVMRNPGALGLIEGARRVDESSGPGSRTPETWGVKLGQLDNRSLIEATVDAIGRLEEHGYVAPYVCVYGRGLFKAAHQPINVSMEFPRDRLEPLIGRELLHASALNIAPKGNSRLAPAWRNRGVLLSLAGDAIDLVVACEATPEFGYGDARGGYRFSVFERFALRIKDPKAIVALTFQAPKAYVQSAANPAVTPAGAAPAAEVNVPEPPRAGAAPDPQANVPEPPRAGAGPDPQANEHVAPLSAKSLNGTLTTSWGLLRALSKVGRSRKLRARPEHCPDC